MNLRLRVASDSGARKFRSGGSAALERASKIRLYPSYALPYGHARGRVGGCGTDAGSRIKMRRVTSCDQAGVRGHHAPLCTHTYALARMIMRPVVTFVSANFRERDICEVRTPPLLQAETNVSNRNIGSLRSAA
jgi:hypothetical protein